MKSAEETDDQLIMQWFAKTAKSIGRGLLLLAITGNITLLWQFNQRITSLEAKIDFLIQKR